MANDYDRQVQKVCAMMARNPPDIEIPPCCADRNPDQGLKMVDRARACRSGNADALSRDGGHDRRIMHDGAAHFMKIVEEMSVDSIGSRTHGHSTNGGTGAVIRIDWKVELPWSHDKCADMPKRAQCSRGL